MIAKDSLVSSVVAITVLTSVALHRPLMSAGLKPFMTKGRLERTAAWDRLSADPGASAGWSWRSARSGCDPAG